MPALRTAALSVRTLIETQDHRLMLRVHRWTAPRWIRVWMIYATRGGDGWLWYALGVWLLLAGPSGAALAVAESLLAATAGIVVFLKLKRWSGRRRPCALQPHCWSTLLPPDQFSFPSGHTITAFAVCTPLWLWRPELAPALGFCAASVALSRILLGMHFLSDVIAGAGIGLLLGWGAWAGLS
jgi:undecaprenyl-diphosphatase